MSQTATPEDPLARPLIDPEADRPLLGMGLFALGIFGFAFVDSVVRLLAAAPPEGYGMALLPVVVLRCLTGFLAVGVAAALTRTWPWKTRRLGLHLLRGGCFVGIMVCLFQTLALLPLFLAYTLFFTAPVLIVLLSALLLGERLSGTRLGALGLGIVGVVVSQDLLSQDRLSLDPENLNDDAVWGVAAGLGAALFYAAMVLITRFMGRRETFASLMFYSLAVPFVVLLIPAALVWEAWPTLEEWGLLLVAGLAGGLCLSLIFTGIRLAPAGQVAVLEYSGLIWGALVGWWWFGDVLQPHQILGAAIIMGAGLLVAAPHLILAMRGGLAWWHRRR